MELFAVTENIFRHSLKVREVAMKVSDLLIEKEVAVDRETLKAAALLHDIQKCEPHHAERGARVLADLGYEKIGDLISTHMEIEVQEDTPLSENEILYLSDKLVMEDQLVNPLKREQATLEKFRDNPMVAEKVKIRYQNLNLIRKKIEGIIGKGLWDEQKDLFGQAW
jgi:putative nucleotidyltransferase with HDIG domain